MIRNVLRASALTRSAIACAVLTTVAATANAAGLNPETLPGRWLAPLVPEDLPALTYPAYFNEWDKATMQVATGRYKLALQTLRGVHPTDKGVDPVSMADLKYRALSAIGRDAEAMAVLSDPALVDAPRVQVDRAMLLADTGHATDAIALLREHLRAHPDSLDGHYQLGLIAEQVDDVPTAREAYAWFVAPPQDYLRRWREQGEKLFTRAADATTVGLALDRWAVLNSEYQKDDQLNNTVLDLFVKAYDVIERGYGPAHVAAARFYVAHDDRANAEQELKLALHANPHDADALAMFGAMSGLNFKQADAIVAALQQIDAGSVAAELLETQNLLNQREPKQAEVVVQRLVDRRPDLLEARGLLAATEALQLHDEQTKALLAQVDKLAPTDAQAYFEVAEQLGAMRQYPRSAAMYQVAIDRAPWWNAPRNGLGLLYTQSGEEDLARQTLQAAHEIDPFNVGTTNYLRLLDQLNGFATKESAHFILRYDPKLDPVIPEYFNDYLEAVYASVTGEYQTEPPSKTIIEVFPTHDAFSVRTAGTPWIGTVGASTGRIIALVSPRRGGGGGTFDWSQVLRHEFTHTVTLAATDNRISHWMTEGLAVVEQHQPVQWNWVPMLYHAVSTDHLFDMNQLSFAFARFDKPADRQLAYAESFWVCTYIEQTFGHKAILAMLNEFKHGGLQEDVFPKILGRTQEQFFTEFSAWTKQQVAGWGYDKASAQKYDELRAQAEERIAAKDYPGAVAVWEQINRLRPMDELPHQRLGGLYLATGQPAKAIEQFKALQELEPSDDKYARAIARLYRDAGDYKQEATYALQAVYLSPYDMAAHTLLEQACGKSGDEAGLARERRVIPVLQQWAAEQQK